MSAASHRRPLTSTLQLMGRGSVGIVDDQWRMIGETAAFVDRGGRDAVAKLRAHQLIIDAPADVLLPGTPAVRPPCVLPGLLIDYAEGIDVADLADELLPPRTLLV